CALTKPSALPSWIFLHDRQRTSVMFVVGQTGGYEHVRIKELLHFLRSFPVAALILPSRSCCMSSLTWAVVIGSGKPPVKTKTLPFRTNSPPACVGSSRKPFPSTDRRSLSPGKRLNCSRRGLGSTT